MKRAAALRIIKPDNTEKYFLCNESLLKVWPDNRMALIKFSNGDGTWHDTARFNPNEPVNYHFSQMIFTYTRRLKQISKEEAFEILL